MNSHTSSSCLLVLIAILVTATAVSGTPIVSPPAKIAGQNSNSLTTLKKVVGAVSKITAPNTIATVAPYLNNFTAINETFYDSANHSLKNDSNRDNVSVVHGTLNESAWYQLTFMVLTVLSCCLMVITAFVYRHTEYHKHCRYVENHTMGIAMSHYISFFSDKSRRPTVANFKSTGIYKLIIIINSNVWQWKTNTELYNILKFMDNLPKFKEKISKGTKYDKFYWGFQLISTAACCIDIFHQVDGSFRLIHNPKILGLLQIHIQPSILTELIPGLFNIIDYLYLLKSKKIPISSIHPDLLSFYEKKIATRNLMFKLSVLMFTADFLYILNITMEWNLNIILFLHLLKSAQGILIFYVIVYRPFAPVLYNKLMKPLRRRKRSANEETPLEVTTIPVYRTTTV